MNMDMEPKIRVTISLPPYIVAFADEIAAQKKMSRSSVIAESVKVAREQYERALLIEAYTVLAEENLGFAKMVEALAEEDWPTYEESTL